VVVDVVEHDGADHGRELDGDFVEGDDDSPVGGLGDCCRAFLVRM
jgi:hypothetical protein